MRHLVWKRLRRNPFAIGGLVILSVLVALSLGAPLVAPYEPDAVDPIAAMQGPSRAHLLGTDDLGRDTLSRILHAGRISLSVGLFTALVAVGLGSLLGSVAGYYGGFIDAVISRTVDVFFCLPVLPLAMVIGAFTEITPTRLMLILGGVSWMGVARLVRGEIMVLRSSQFTEAAHCIGASDKRIIFLHLLPNAIAPVIVAATLLVAFAILMESALSFLGFGIQPPTATWGNMLLNAQRYVRTAAWLAVVPGAMITLTVVSINFLGDGLREAIDPRLKVG